MAKRCFFRIAESNDDYSFLEQVVEFKFHNGFSSEQKKRSIESMHSAIQENSPLSKILEVSSKSDSLLGVSLSAFNLQLNYGSIKTSVEAAFQGSKVFENAGPFRDLLRMPPWQAKGDPRLKSQGLATGYLDPFDVFHPLGLNSSFYDMLYLSALSENPELLMQMSEFDTFTDIEFNKTKIGLQPGKSFNTQARACAIAATLYRREGLPGVQGRIDRLSSPTTEMFSNPTLF